MTAVRAGRDAWQMFDDSFDDDRLVDVYNERWSFFTGTAFGEAMRRSGYRIDPRIYSGTSLLWKHVEGTVMFYAMTVYQGELSTDTKPLPDGSKGAIPIVPQTGTDEQNQRLLTAISELFSAWNWRQQMTLRPMYGAALGDVLTELVDDPERGMAYPSVVWPGYVKDIELDYVGNVKSYTLEYFVEEHLENRRTRYLFRKEVDGNEFRYFRGGKPYDEYGDGAVVPHDYGFAPAIWDRHKVQWGVRGASAIDGTRQALVELNSLLSHGKHFQHKAFSAPIVVKGRMTAKGQTEVNLSKPPARTGASRPMAETTEWIQGDEFADIVQPTFDVGQTLAMIKLLQEGIIDENPESRFFRELRNMSQVTGPGAERLLGDATGRCRNARAGYDANTVKLFQMAIAMCGNRANMPPSQGGWTTPLTKRQTAFKPFDLTSYKAGRMDFMIGERPVVMPTEMERIQLVHQKEMMQTAWGLNEIGIEGAEAETILADRATQQWRSINGGSYAGLVDQDDAQ